ncbi:MAG: hypothetical protein ACRYGA_06260 [Janthinobacterium lividum]
MDKLADPDTFFLVPCAHCDALFQEGERFCPACGENQLFSAAPGTMLMHPGAAPGLSDAAAVQGVGWSRPRMDETPDTGIGPVPSAAQARASGRRPSAIAVLGIVASLAIVAFGSMWGIDRYDGMRHQAGRQQAYETTVARMSAALDRDDLAGAEHAFSMLDATQIEKPDMQALKQRLDRHMSAQARRREQLSDAAQNASRSLGFGTGSTADAANPTGTAAPPPKDCNDALAALALCHSQ